MDAAPAPTHRSHLPQRLRLQRMVGLAAWGLGTAYLLWQHGRPLLPAAQLLLAAVALGWPQLAFWHARRAADPVRAEHRNMVVDGALGGFAVCAFGGSLVPSAVVLAIVVMNSLSVGGPRLLAAALAAMVAGGLATVSMLPWRFQPESSLAVQMLGMSLMLLYTAAFGWGLNRLAGNLRSSREALRRTASEDALSGVHNRGSFEQQLHAAFAVLHGQPGAASLLLCDVDHFKQINDSAGHASGDAVIRHVGATLRASVRPLDVPGRFGGDEFVVLLHDAGAEQALAFVQRLRNNLQARRRNGDALPNFTLSIGVACHDPAIESADAWMARADAALYAVKRRGRGGVEVDDRGATTVHLLQNI